MKNLMFIIAALIVAFPSVSAASPSQKCKVVKSPYAEQYRILKKSLELDKESLSQTEALEAVAVKFAGMFDRASDMIERLSARTAALEAENILLKARLDKSERRISENEKRIEDLEARVKVFDGDLDKVFRWMNKADDDLYNEYSPSQTAIGAKLKKLDGQVNNWWTGLNAQMDKLCSAVNVNSENIKVLWNSIRR